MENTQKQRYLNIAIFICIYLIIAGIPFHYVIDNGIVISLINIGLKIGFLVFSYYYLKKYELFKPKYQKLQTKHLLFLPFLIITISNFIACLLFKYEQLNQDVYFYNLIVDLFTCLSVSICEELCFRVVLHSELLAKYKPLKAIFISSLVFGLVHLFNITSIGAIVPSLIQVLYSFGLGLILSLLYTYSSNYILPIILHFLFNYLNNYVVTYFCEKKYYL